MIKFYLFLGPVKYLKAFVVTTELGWYIFHILLMRWRQNEINLLPMLPMLVARLLQKSWPLYF